MKNMKLTLILLGLSFAVIALFVWHKNFNYEYANFEPVPKIPLMPMDSAVIRSTMPQSMTISSLAMDNILSDLRTRKPEVAGVARREPPAEIDVKLKGLSKIGGTARAILEIGGATRVTNPAGAKPPPSSSRKSGSNLAVARQEMKGGLVTNATGVAFVASRLYKEGDPLPILAGDSGYLKQIAPNGEKAVIIVFMGREYKIDLKYDYKLLQSKMEQHKKELESTFSSKMKSVESAIKESQKSDEQRQFEKRREEFIRRDEEMRQTRQRIRQEVQTQNGGGTRGGAAGTTSGTTVQTTTDNDMPPPPPNMERPAPGDGGPSAQSGSSEKVNRSSWRGSRGNRQSQRSNQ